MAMNGTDILIYIEGTVVGSQRDCSWEETTDEIDVSSKDSRSRRLLPGRYGSTISLDALYVPADVAYLALESAMRNGTFVTVKRTEDAVEVEEAEAIVTNLRRNGPDQAESVVSCTLTVDGSWVELGT